MASDVVVISILRVDSYFWIINFYLEKLNQSDWWCGDRMISLFV